MHKILFIILVIPCFSLAARDSGGDNKSGYFEKYKQRSRERFDILSYLTEQKSIKSSQDSKWGNGAKGKLPLEYSLNYAQSLATLKRDNTLIGTAKFNHARGTFIFNGLFNRSDSKRSINIDVGIEAFYQKAYAFTRDTTSSQTNWTHEMSGGGLILRPFGKSSQDTSLMFRVGYLALSESGIWTNTTPTYSLNAWYGGADLRIYLLPFLGAKGRYDTTFTPTSNDLTGLWELQSLKYGAFIELYLLEIEGFAFSDRLKYTPRSGTAVSDDSVGAGASATLFF